jgi:nitrate reductase gamma subunit
MSVLVSLAAVFSLVIIAYVGAGAAGMHAVFGIWIPYLAAAIFLIGFISRILKWARIPVPFNITTSCGQQKTLPWIKDSKLESPSSTAGVIGRMALEVLFFRSLFRNTSVQLRRGSPKLIYWDNMFLWGGAMAFHWCFLIILFRHTRFFLAEKTPFFVTIADRLDGFFQYGSPTIYVSSFVILGALGYLFLRRLLNPQVKYISLLQDYFPLFLLLGIATTGCMMRYLDFRTDVMAVTELAHGLATFHPPAAAAMPLGATFYIHIFLVSTLLVYFPFSKLMHMGGVFLSPTRNMISATRMFRHVNPWNPTVKVHTYEEYEDEFREKMKDADIPVDKE